MSPALRSTPLVLALLIFLVAPQTGVTQDQSATVIHRGIVVESLTADGEAQRGGMKAGDLLLNWIGPTGKGEIESPFELPYLGFEEIPRGLVTFEGLRRGKRRTWLLRTIPWGIGTRPNIDGDLLRMYLQAEALAHSGELLEAVQGWRKAATLAQHSGVSWLSAWFLSHSAEALYRGKQPGACDDLYREALRLTEESGPKIRGDLLRQWATQLEGRDNLVDAERYYREELLEWQRLGAEMLVAINLNVLGGVLSAKGEFQNAESYFIQSLAITEKVAPASFQTATSYGNLAVIYQDRGDLGKAEKYYRATLAIEKKYFPNTYYLAQILTDFGILARWQGNLALAEKSHREALAIVKQLDLPLKVAEILDNISDCRLDRNDLIGAEIYQKRALSIREDAGASLSIAWSLSGLGRIARLEEKLDNAERYYRRALEIADKLDPPRPDRAAFLAGLADVMRDRGNSREAEQTYRQALMIMEQVAPQSLDHAETLAALGKTLRREGRLEEAADSYRRSLSDLEDQSGSAGSFEESQARYRARYDGYYREYVDVLIEQGQRELAFQTLERSHARSLFEMLTHADINVRQGVDAALLKRESEVRQSLNAKVQHRIRLFNQQHTDEQLRGLDQEILNLREAHSEIEAEIRTSSPAYAALAQPEALGLAATQKLLDPQTVILEYSLGEDRSHVWVVGDNSLGVREIPKRSKVDQAARQLYTALTSRMQRVSSDPKVQVANWAKADAHAEAIAESLSRMILMPVADLIKGKRLLIVSDGALQYVPFPVLPAPGKPRVPLMVEHEIVSLPSASVLAEIRQFEGARPSPLQEVAIFADPVFDPKDERVRITGRDATPKPGWTQRREQVNRSASDSGIVARNGFFLNRLPYTRDEADAIMAVTPRGKVVKALGFRANRATAIDPKLGQFRIIHFATHGFLDSKHPELSGLVLSLVDENGRPQDGFLGLEDVYNMKLPVDLVVLSGCRTGLGEDISGEGLIGLTRGFIYAGASRVVASLWSVDDYATSELMARFYRAMEVDKMRPAAALRKAQIQIWKHSGWQAPYYWAAFQIQGEWK